QVTGEDPTKCAQDREARYGDQGGQILWRKGELDRIEAHYTERVDLLRHDHRSDLCRNGRRGPATHTEGGDERAQFPGEADCDQVYDKPQSVEPPQLGGALESQYEPG